MCYHLKMRRQADKFARNNSFDLYDNYIQQLRLYKDVTADEWSSVFSLEPTVLHRTSTESLSLWLNNPVLRPFSKITDGAQAPEASIGNSTEEDIRRGMDDFTFFSLGRVSLVGPSKDGPLGGALIVMDPGLIKEGIVSIRSLEDYGSLLLGVDERFGEHDEAEVQENNHLAFESYASNLVKGEEFHEIFAKFLTREFKDTEDYLWRYDALPKDLHRHYDQSVVMREEWAAKRKWLEAIGHQMKPALRQMDFIENHGFYYMGPQLIVPGNVGKKFVKGVIWLGGAGNLDNARRQAEKKSIPMQVLNIERVEHIYREVALPRFIEECSCHNGSCSSQYLAIAAMQGAVNIEVNNIQFQG